MLTTELESIAETGGLLVLRKYKMVKREGITTALTNSGKILIVKRIRFPFISHPGMWSFVSGKREKGEKYLQSACREIFEETKIGAERLTLLGSTSVMLKDERSGLKWQNRLFVFRSSSRAVKLNIENTNYKWVSFDQLCRSKDLGSMLSDKKHVFSLIKSCMRL